MTLNDHIEIARKFLATQQSASVRQDDVEKSRFALEMMERMPQKPVQPSEPPKIPSLGAMAVPN